MSDFRRPGRPLLFSPDFPNHALVGLRSELWAEVGDGIGKAAYRGVFEAPTSPPKE